MAVRDEIIEQTKKFKDMTVSQKLDYIWTYFKWWIIGTFAMIFIIVSLVKSIRNNSRPVYLDAMFLNSTLSDSGVECNLEEKFCQRYKVNTDEYATSFDYMTYIDNNYGNQQSVASQVKIVSKYSAGQLDIVCGPESVLTDSADPGGYSNLSEVLPDGMLDEILAKGYEPFYYTEKVYADDAEPDENGDIPYTDGETYIGGIYIDNSSVLVGSDSTCVYNGPMDDRWVLTVAWNTEHLDHAVEFIEFVTE